MTLESNNPLRSQALLPVSSTIRTLSSYVPVLYDAIARAPCSLEGLVSERQRTSLTHLLIIQ